MVETHSTRRAQALLVEPRRGDVPVAQKLLDLTDIEAGVGKQNGTRRDFPAFQTGQTLIARLRPASGIA